ncbi:MAG: hypothetical protein AAF443_06660 [Chlamydiota bacterium]
MKHSPHKLKHQKHKAIQKVQDTDYQTDTKEIQESSKKIYLTSLKRSKIAHAKASSPHKHHKTSPSDVTWETEPDSAHREGTRWVRVIQKQTKDAALRLYRKRFKK